MLFRREDQVCEPGASAFRIFPSFTFIAGLTVPIKCRPVLPPQAMRLHLLYIVEHDAAQADFRKLRLIIFAGKEHHSLSGKHNRDYLTVKLQTKASELKTLQQHQTWPSRRQQATWLRGASSLASCSSRIDLSDRAVSANSQ